MIKKLLEIIYPQKCISCLEIIEHGHFCEKCEKNIKTVDVNEPIAIFDYEDVKHIIHRFKFDRKAWVGKVLGDIMAEFLKEKHGELLDKADLIIPVPLHLKKLKNRGFNQSEIIALEIGRILGLVVDKNALIRVRDDLAQSLVERDKRDKNVEGAFSVIKDISGKNILLVDDVYTTGSTAKSIQKELEKAGASRVNVITLAISTKGVVK
ncbi:MAG: ComF family protein [Defluviitaleaceae bacterium]|nr:ComF family protein [Defluviitaleaceae bacterium]